MPTKSHRQEIPIARDESESDLVIEYFKYVKPAPDPRWRGDSDNFSLDQPWPVEFHQTETSYGTIMLELHA